MYVKDNRGRWHEVSNLEVCSIGGGFLTRIPAGEIRECRFEKPEIYHLALVGFEDAAVSWAYVNEHDRWNGWIKPLIPAANLKLFVRDYYEQYDRSDDEVAHFATRGGRLYYLPPPATCEGEEWEAVEPTAIEVAGKTLHVYPVSLGLCWEIMSDEDHEAREMLEGGKHETSAR